MFNFVLEGKMHVRCTIVFLLPKDYADMFLCSGLARSLVALSDVPAWLGLKAAAWAWLQAAWAFRICKPGPSRQ
jgi:hypothetical protein